MVGLDKINSVVLLANAQEQRQIAAELVDDLLTTQHQIEFRLETMQTPSLDEAKAMVVKACEIVLNVRSVHGLPAAQERKLIEWLKVRDVSIGKSSFHFDFNTLEQWIGRHEEMLLTMLGTDYSSLVADEVEAGRSQALELSTVSGRVDRLFGSLAAKGEESRADLWKLVDRYLKLSPLELQSCALTTLEQSHQLAGSQPLSACLVTIVRNLIEHPSPAVDYERDSAGFYRLRLPVLENLRKKPSPALLTWVAIYPAENSTRRMPLLSSNRSFSVNLECWRR